MITDKSYWTLVFAMIMTGTASAQSTPLGLWQSIDDKTGEAKAEIRIVEKDGQLRGWIEKSLKKGVKADAVCDECGDERKGKPIAGLEIIRGGRQAAERAVWENGRILDPENGREYRASFTPVEGGRKLELRGYFGPFWRTQIWQRIGP